MTKNISRILSILIIFVFLLSSMPSHAVSAAAILYVRPDGSGDCSSWEAACGLQNALAGAQTGNEIWVAEGTYLPTQGTDRSATFQLKNGVAVYGGFAGGETNRHSRNWELNVTTLSGDIGSAGVPGDNVYHIVTGDDGATLDGFTITGGQADGSDPDDHGGGVYNIDSNPTLSNLIISNNMADAGGGMFNDNSSPHIVSTIFKNNVASVGGGMENDFGSEPDILYSQFLENEASAIGGGIRNYDSSPFIQNTVFKLNHAVQKGGGMENEASSRPNVNRVTFEQNTTEGSGGGMSNVGTSNPTISTVVFKNNQALLGGGMQNETGSRPTLNGVTFLSNSAEYGGGMRNVESSPVLQNCTFENNTAVHKGGAMELSGAYPGTSASSSNTFNSTFSGNNAENGGAVYAAFPSFPWFTNVTFHANSASQAGGTLFMDGYDGSVGSIFARNTILWGDSAPVSPEIGFANGIFGVIFINSIAQAMDEHAGAVSEDPLLGSLGYYGGNTPTIPLLAGSPAIDAGNDTYCLSLDQRDLPRQGAHCDIGAYEYYADSTLPVVSAFDTLDSYNHLTIPIYTFMASDNQQLAGYLVTTSATPPTKDTEGWKPEVISDYTFGTDGTYSLYPWVMDAAGNISAVYATPAEVVVDTTPPHVLSNTRLDVNGIRFARLHFLVTFSEDVLGVDGGDFTLTKTGQITDESITEVSGGPSVYTVTVDTGTGGGTLRLDVRTAASIADLALNPLTGLPYEAGETYIVPESFTLFLPIIFR